MKAPIPSQSGKRSAEVVKNFIEYTIKPPQQSIPRIGVTGAKGTLNGRGLSGSVLRRIKTATHTIINEVNVPKLQSSAATFKSSVSTPTTESKATVHVKTCGVWNFGCNF